MVEFMNGYQSHYRDFMQDRGMTLADGFRHTVFFSNPTHQVEVTLREVISKPQYDQESRYLFNVRGSYSDPVKVLVVPRTLPVLDSEYNATTRGLDHGLLPPDGSTYIVGAWDVQRPNRMLEIPIVESESSDLRSIVKRRASDELGCFRRDIRWHVELASVDELIEFVKKQIDKEEYVPTILLRFSNLWPYYQEHRDRLAANTGA